MTAYEEVPAGKPIAERPIAPDLSIADPAPLGLAGFAATTMVLSLSNAHVWVSAAGAALAMAVAYGGTAQFLAGMWEFKRNNTFGATAFSSYGAFWWSYFALVFGVVPNLPKDTDAATLVGTYLFVWTVFTAYMTIASLRVSVAIVVVFVLLTATFALLTIGAFESSTGWTETGGWIGVATAAAAWYASFAGVTNSTFKRVVVPTGPLTAL